MKELMRNKVITNIHLIFYLSHIFLQHIFTEYKIDTKTIDYYFK